jgi:hypothetical protein
MSQMRMHALFLPRTSDSYGAAPIGRASASRTAARGSESLAIGRLPITVGRASRGSRTCISDLP